MAALLNLAPLVLAILAAYGAFVCKADPGVHDLLMLIAGGLATSVLPALRPGNWLPNKPRDQQAGHGSPVTFFIASFVGLVLLFGVAFTFTLGCHQVKPDQFFEATVDCAKVNPDGSAALGSVTTCLVSATTGNPASCLSGLVTEARFTVTEVACVVAWIADRENKKVALSTAGPASLEVRNRAIAWIVQEHINIRNTYHGAP